MGWTGWVGGWWKGWRPTSPALLAQAEARMLHRVAGRVEVEEVEVDGEDVHVPHTVHTIRLGQGPPLVLVHGFAAAVGHWACNLDELAKHHTVYAIDLVGFGRSSRPAFTPESPEHAEHFFVASIEGWRKKVGLDRFALLGHSFGGYLAGCYSLRHPEHVDALILADPWGLPRRTAEDVAKAAKMSWRWRLAKNILQNFSPLAAIRVAGPYGPGLIHRVRPDLSSKWVHYHKEEGTSEVIQEEEEEEEEEERVPTSRDEAPTAAGAASLSLPPVIDYVYHSNAQLPPTGELAFHKMMNPIGWAARPLCDRLHHLDASIPVTFLYGEESWMDPRAAVEVMRQIENQADIVIIPRAGHHVYIDNVPFFNRAVLKATGGSDRLGDTNKEQA